jgi:hypothetical protein
MSIHMEYRRAEKDDFEALDRQWLSPKLHALLTSAAAYLLYWMLAFMVLMTVAAIATAIDIKTLGDGSILSSADLPPWTEAAIIVVLWGPVFLVPGIVSVRRYRRVVAWRLPAWKDRQEQRVQIVELDGEPYTTIEVDGVGKFYVFDLPGAGALCLAMENHFLMKRTWQIMQQLEETGDYTDDDLEKALSKDLPAFPARHFQLHRWRHTGAIVDIRVLGPEQEAEEIVTAVSPAVAKRLIRDAWGRDSVVIQATRANLR